MHERIPNSIPNNYELEQRDSGLIIASAQNEQEHPHPVNAFPQPEEEIPFGQPKPHEKTRGITYDETELGGKPFVIAERGERSSRSEVSKPDADTVTNKAHSQTDHSHGDKESSVTSREQKRTPEVFDPVLIVGEASEARRGEDTMINRQDIGLFGVFDGLGGHLNGAEASKAAAQGIEGYYEANNTQVSSVEEAINRAKDAVKTAEQNVQFTPEVGQTTAVFAKIEQIDGAPYLVWGNIGDSRMFIQSGGPRGKIEAISTDQSRGNVVFNTIRPGEDKEGDSPDEFGALPLARGDRIMLCSDGITGDWEHQFLTEAEMRRGFEDITPQQSADEFVRMSKKPDDKSVLVIDVEEKLGQDTQEVLDTSSASTFEDVVDGRDYDDIFESETPIAHEAPAEPKEDEIAVRGIRGMIKRFKDSREARLTPIKPEQLVDEELESITVNSGSIDKNVRSYLKNNGFKANAKNRSVVWDAIEQGIQDLPDDYDGDIDTMKFNMPEEVRKKLASRKF